MQWREDQPSAKGLANRLFGRPKQETGILNRRKNHLFKKVISYCRQNTLLYSVSQSNTIWWPFRARRRRRCCKKVPPLDVFRHAPCPDDRYNPADRPLHQVNASSTTCLMLKQAMGQSDSLL